MLHMPVYKPASFPWWFSSVAQSCLTLCNPMNHSMPGLPVHHQLPESTQNSCPLSRWCHPAILSSVVPFSSCPPSLQASESFPMSQLFATPWIAACQASLSITISRSSCPLSRWCHPAILSSVIPFSSCPPSFPASGFFQMSQLFSSGGQNIGVSVSKSVLPMNTQDWSPLGWTDWISLQSQGLSRVISNTTVQKHQFYSTQRSL